MKIKINQLAQPTNKSKKHLSLADIPEGMTVNEYINYLESKEKLK